ncbi:hypothetical protein VN12_15775 [Pirellula sp. SH-Sr6A]|nr:hypothetical protein VN12_15775 [Pirellula sp. SH-Sr6A]
MFGSWRAYVDNGLQFIIARRQLAPRRGTQSPATLNPPIGSGFRSIEAKLGSGSHFVFRTGGTAAAWRSNSVGRQGS